MTAVVVEGEITKIEPSRKVKSKKEGKDHTVTNAILRDKSGEITLVLWDTEITQVKVSEKYRIEFGKVNSYRNKLQLNIGYGRIIKPL